MGRFALAATPTNVQQQQQQQPPEQEQTVQRNNSASNDIVNVASPDEDSTPLKVTDEGVAVEEEEGNDRRLSVEAPNLDTSEMTLDDDSGHGVEQEVAGASSSSNVQELDLTGDDDEIEGGDAGDRRAASNSLDHGDEPPVVTDGRDGEELP